MTKYLVALAIFLSSQAYASDAIESLNISLSDIEGIEDVIYEQYLQEKLGDDFEVVHGDLVETEDGIEFLLSGSNQSIDLDILSKVGALEVAFNPLKKSIYAEVDFMALALAKDHKQKVENSNNEAKWLLAVGAFTVLVFALAANNKPSKSKAGHNDAAPLEDIGAMVKKDLEGYSEKDIEDDEKLLEDEVLFNLFKEREKICNEVPEPILCEGE